MAHRVDAHCGVSSAHGTARSRVRRLVLLGSVLGARVTHADDEFVVPDVVAQLGAGVATRLGEPPRGTDRRAVALALRWGFAEPLAPRVLAGAFIEGRTVDVATVEGAVGGHAHLRVASSWSLQLRAGAGVGLGTAAHALGALRVGTTWIGASVVARRFRADGGYEVAAMFELTPLALVLPFVGVPLPR